MKKNISINLQGMIFHIEEDGYEQLSQYLAAIKAYFSAYAGHEEIIADIEARIAEIFFAKLSPTKQVITSDDVQALIAQMGSVKDFQNLEADEPEYAATAAAQPESNHYSQATGEQTTSRRLYRDVNRKVIGGVAAGIANYLNVDPLWIRLAFVFLTLLFAVPGGFPAGLVLVAYILCWIAFPVSYSLPETTTKKLFRNPYDKKLGGVASGIALFFGMDVGVIRLLFLISALLGGFGFVAYIILWIIVPEASSITDRVQMQGNPVTLNSIEESLKTNLHMRDENGRETPLAHAVLFPVRLVAQVFGFLARVLGPFISFLVTLIRILAGALLIFIAGTLIFGLIVMAFTALGLIDGSDFINTDVPFALFTNTFPAYGLVAGFFAGLIPCIFLLVLALGLLLKRFYLRPAIGWSFFGIWILSIFVMILSIIQFRNNFRENAEYVAQKDFPVTAYKTVLLRARDTDSFRNGYADIEVQSYPGTTVKLVQEFRAKGATEAEAARNATMITYRADQQDSVITFDYNYKFKPDAIYREQDVSLRLLLPENKQFRISESFARMLPSSAFDRDYDTGNYEENYISNHLWQIKKNEFVCLDCPPADTTAAASASAQTDWESDNRVTLDSPLRNENDYGGDSRSFNFSGFERVRVSGVYHVKIRKGDTFSVKARGENYELRELEINQDGDRLEIKPRRNRFRFSFGDREPVLITVIMPELKELNLSGAVKVDASGFTTDSFRLNESGAVKSALSIKCEVLDIDVSGACETAVAGSAEHLKLEASGACQVRAGGFKATTAEVGLAGASNARVFVTRHLKANVSGPSHLTYKGNPQTVDSDQSGMGSIEAD
jgi:phage shock protein PspC (stress-responsive transcriptional regulator)